MDRAIYLAMSGAKENLYAQAVNNHNLANANTHGFRQSLSEAYTTPVRGPVYDSRDYVQVGNEFIDFSPGALQSTGRDLDLAIQNEGFIAVRAPDGGTAYSRAGNLHLDPQGILRTDRGLEVLGDDGPIAVPPYETLTIGSDGTISVRPQGAGANAQVAVNRIRLVNPDVKTLKRGEDGLIRSQNPAAAVPPDANVRVVSGMLETSNVNTVTSLTRMIELSRHYELQIKMMKTVDGLEQTHNKLLGIS